MSAADHLKTIRERVEAATQGPWRWEEPSTDDFPTYDQSLVSDAADTTVVSGWGYDASGTEASDEDREFIAHARTDLPRLLDALEGVMAVHKQDDDMPLFCHACDDYWPCPTVTAINDALEGK